MLPHLGEHVRVRPFAWALAVGIMMLALVVMTEGGGGGSTSQTSDDSSIPSPSPSVVMTAGAEVRTTRFADSHPASAPIMGVSRAPHVSHPGLLTPLGTPPPQSPETPPEAADSPYRLTRDDFFILARTVGYEREWVIAEAFRVACGGGSTVYGESYCTPSAFNGHHIGLFQIDPGWSEFCGVDAWALYYPAVNLACARMIVLYEEANGLPRWTHWEVQP